MFFKSLKLFWSQEKQWSRIPVKYGDKHIFSSLRTGQQGVPWTFSRKGGFAHCLTYSLSQQGFQHLAMLFYQQKSKSRTDILRSITSYSLYIHAYKYYATIGGGGQPIVDKLGRKRLFSLKTPIKTDQAQKNCPLIRILC